MNIEQRLQQIKDDVAREHEYNDWKDLLVRHTTQGELERYIDKVVVIYSKEYAERYAADK